MSKQLQRIALIRSSATRKTLVTAREYDSPRKREIDLLRKQGMFVQQIAERLGVSVKAIDSYMPYKRGTYIIPAGSKNAEKLRECRATKECVENFLKVLGQIRKCRRNKDRRK